MREKLEQIRYILELAERMGARTSLDGAAKAGLLLLPGILAEYERVAGDAQSTKRRRVGYSITTDVRLISTTADELEQLGLWVRTARDFSHEDAIDEIARAIENRVHQLRGALPKDLPA